MKRVQLRDVVTLGASTETPEGFIVADATFSRTGCQDYTRRELGLDGNPNDVVTLYRPPEEVFSPVSLASMSGKPLALNHPPEDVTADTWAKYAVGDAGAVSKGSDGQTTVGKATLRRRDAVDAYKGGTRELSVGYAFDLDMTPGTAPDGTKYHGVQRNILANHHAVVDEGRCGGRCRIGDDKPKAHDCACSTRKGTDMPTMRKISTADAKLTFTDSKGKDVAIPVLELDFDVSTPEGLKALDAVDRFTRGIKDCMAAHDSVKAEVGVHKERADAAETRLKELDAMPESDDEDEDGGEDTKGKDAKPKLGDAALAYVTRLKARAVAAKDEKVLEARATERQAVIDSAKKILGADFKADGKTVADIKTATVKAAIETKDSALSPIATSLVGADLAKASADKIAAAFDAVVAAHGAIKTGDRQTITDSEREVGAALAGGNGTAGGGDKPKLVGRDHLMNRMFGGA